MTQTKEQERAEFEGWARKCCYDIERVDGAIQYTSNLTEQVWMTWQASRRAQVVPDGYRLQPLSEYEAMCAFVAAAPQPPEAASVQMPEPAEFQVRIRPTWDAKHHWTIWEKCTPEAAADYERTPLLHEWEYEVRKLYTEQQVRDLLAENGGKPQG